MKTTTLQIRRMAGAAVASLGFFAVVSFMSGHALADALPPSQTSPPIVVPAQQATAPPDPSAAASTDDDVTSSAASGPPATSGDFGAPPTEVVDAPTATDSSAPAATVANNVTSTAQSGDATVDHNQTAGDATSGNALGTTTTVTSVGSSTVSGQTVGTFVITVPSSMVGNITINPSQLATSSPTTSVVTSANTTDPSVAVNVNVQASTGNASVTSNCTAGDATSGNADAEANVATIADTTVNTPQFFVGVINVYGDLTGDILLPAQYASSALSPVAGQGGGSAANAVDIVDNLAASAESGTASVEHNTTAGNATSGSATTSITECDVVGSQFAGSGIVFVLVNVQGKWVGFVMNGPAAAATILGTGDASETTGAPMSAATMTIYNNILAAARSGDALVADNGIAGSATSGDAMASISLLNLADSTINTSHWLGILFINIFGNWTGGLGTLPTVSTPHTPTTPAPTKHMPTARLTLTQSGVSSETSGQDTGYSTELPQVITAAHELPAVLGATHLANTGSATGKADAATNKTSSLTWWLLGAFLLADSIVAGGYIRNRRKEQKG